MDYAISQIEEQAGFTETEGVRDAMDAMIDAFKERKRRYAVKQRLPLP